MSFYGTGIIERLPVNSQLQNPDNPMHIIIQNAIGELLDNFEIDYDQFFLQDATGKYLDLHGKQYGIGRKNNESDEEYRNRIILCAYEYATVKVLTEIYGVKLYANVDNFENNTNLLCSDNPYLSDELMGFISEEVYNILDEKFIKIPFRTIIK